MFMFHGYTSLYQREKKTNKGNLTYISFRMVSRTCFSNISVLDFLYFFAQQDSVPFHGLRAMAYHNDMGAIRSIYVRNFY